MTFFFSTSGIEIVPLEAACRRDGIWPEEELYRFDRNLCNWRNG